MFIEQYFNHDIFSLLFLLSVLGFYTVLNFMIFKGACLYFLEWQDSNPEAELKVRKWNGADFFHEIVQSNYIYLLFWYWFTDIGSIFIQRTLCINVVSHFPPLQLLRLLMLLLFGRTTYHSCFKVVDYNGMYIVLIFSPFCLHAVQYTDV